MIKKNIGAEKVYRDLYKEFKTIPLPENYVDFYYEDNEKMDFFYTDEEKKNFRKRILVDKGEK